MVVYVPGLNSMFSMTAVSPAWLLVLPLGAAAFIALDAGRRQLQSFPELVELERK
jgi:hypothetical protein